MKTALIAVGGSLAAVPAAGLELGDVKVHSSLGQPLRASIAYALAPNEAISDACVSLVSAPSTTGMPSVGQGSMIVADGVIAITGQSIVQDPLLSMRVSIRCPYTPQLTREYTLFVDPATPVSETAAAPFAAQPAPVAAQPAAPVRVGTAPTASRPVTSRPASSAPPVAIASRYRVQFGDTVSDIAQRIENRPVGLWQAVNAIFAANPDAFIDNDVNRLKAGAWLQIPDLGSGLVLTVSPAASDTAAPAPEPAAGGAYDPPAPVALPGDAVAATGSLAAEAPADPVVTAPEGEAVPANAAPTAGLEPGDIILDTDIAAAATAGESTVVIPDTELAGPAATSSSPNVATAVIRTSGAREDAGPNWVWWLGGGLLAALAGLLLYGRLSGRFGSRPIGDERTTARRRDTGGDTQRIEAIGDVDLAIGDDSPTAENLVLDADLEIGTGLTESSNVEVAADFAFASTTSLDIELPEEMSSGDSGFNANTDIIPPLNIDPDSILEEEVLPDYDEYDMSVIVDATQMPDPAEVTERDLEAIAVADEDDVTLITGDYTVSQEADYKILEQDYEDEMTATQALNAEIQRAAELLASRMDEEDTREMSLATVHELDITAQLRGRNDDSIGEDDDTGVNPTVKLATDDATAEIDSRGDETVEMQKRGKAR